MLRDAVDGVIVGSAIVRRVERPAPLANVVASVGELVESLAAALQ